MVIPWIRLSELSEKVGYRKILHRRYRMPDGTEADYTIASCPDGVVCILALTRDNHVILARQFRPGPEVVYDEMPGGAIDPGEEPDVAAARELLEETGYQGDLHFVVKIPISGYTSGFRHCYIAHDCEKVAEPNPDPTEFIEVVVKPLYDFVQQVRAGQLTDVDVAYLGLSSYSGLA